jgi:hypothetical protein
MNHNQGWWRRVITKVFSWFKIKVVLETSAIVAILSLCWNVYVSQESQATSIRVIEELTKANITNSDTNKTLKEGNIKLSVMVDSQNQMLEALRTRGVIEVMPLSQSVSVAEPDPAAVNTDVITFLPQSGYPGQFMVGVRINTRREGKIYWIGTISGSQFWPQLPLPPDLALGQEAKYRVSVPNHVKSGALALLAVDKDFDQTLKAQHVDPIYAAGLFFPHLRGVEVLAQKNFP